jgi:hypothetical protein
MDSSSPEAAIAISYSQIRGMENPNRAPRCTLMPFTVTAHHVALYEQLKYSRE